MSSQTKYSRYEWNNIYNIDFLTAARKLPAGVIDTTIYHPPTLPDVEDFTWSRSDSLKHLVWSRDCVAQVNRLSKHNGTVWIIGRPETLLTASNLFLELGWRIINIIRCFQPHITANIETRHWDRKRSFDVIWMAKGKGWCWNADYVRRTWSWKARSSWTVYGLREDEIKYGQCDAQISDIFMENMIMSTTPGDGAVLDPFIGSGTTAVVCERNILKYIGFEVDAKPFRIALARTLDVKLNLWGGI